MRRREFLGLLGRVLTAWPFAAAAEELPHVGVLVPTDRATAELNLEAFRKGLRAKSVTWKARISPLSIASPKGEMLDFRNSRPS
jgi:hypothetical protein